MQHETPDDSSGIGELSFWRVEFVEFLPFPPHSLSFTKLVYPYYNNRRIKMLSSFSCSAVEAHLQEVAVFWLSNYWLCWGLGPLLAAGKGSGLVLYDMQFYVTINPTYFHSCDNSYSVCICSLWILCSRLYVGEFSSERKTPL